eukprot:3934521-Pyramimonas_sp.AAC.1
MEGPEQAHKESNITAHGTTHADLLGCLEASTTPLTRRRPSKLFLSQRGSLLSSPPSVTSPRRHR